MPFGMWTRVGPINDVLDGHPDVLKTTQKVAEPVWCGRRLVCMGLHIGATWWIRLNRSCAAAMRPCVKLLWPLVCLAGLVLP